MIYWDLYGSFTIRSGDTVIRNAACLSLSLMMFICTESSAQRVADGPVRFLGDGSGVEQSMHAVRSNIGAPVIALGGGPNLLLTWERKAQFFTPSLQDAGSPIALSGWARDPVQLPDGRFVVMEGSEHAFSSEVNAYIPWRALVFNADGSGERELIGGKFTEWMSLYPEGMYADWVWYHKAFACSEDVVTCQNFDTQFPSPSYLDSMLVYGKLYSYRIEGGWTSTKTIHHTQDFAWKLNQSDRNFDSARLGASLHRIDARDGEWIYYIRDWIPSAAAPLRYRRYFSIQSIGDDSLASSIELDRVDGKEFTRTEDVLLQSNGEFWIVRMDSSRIRAVVERFSRDGRLLQKKDIPLPYLKTNGIYRLNSIVEVDRPVYSRADLSSATLPGNRLALAWTRQSADESSRVLFRILGPDLEWNSEEWLLADPSEGDQTLPFIISRNDTVFCAWMTKRTSDGAMIPWLKVIADDQILDANALPSAAAITPSIEVYPQPASDHCSVRVDVVAGRPFSQTEGTLTLQDMLGRTLHRESFNANQDTRQLSLQHYLPGCYILRWGSGNQAPLSRMLLIK